MTTSEEMTFVKLHEGIEHLSCVDFENIRENTTGVFIHLVSKNPPDEMDFRSYYEQNIPLRSTGHKNICDHRGVSMNKVDATNEEKVKRAWTALVKVKPRLPHVWCKFTIGPSAGKVWYKPSNTTDTGDSHHNLMKCDQFSMDKIQIIQIVFLR